MEPSPKSSICGCVGCQEVHKVLLTDGVSDSLLEVHHSPTQGTHGLRRMINRICMGSSDEPEVKWFGNSLEAFQYIQRHEEEHLARGFTTVFCKSLGGGDVQDTYEQSQPCAKVDDPLPLWLIQADPAPVHQPVQHTRAVVNDCSATMPPFDGSSHLCLSEHSRSDATFAQPNDETIPPHSPGSSNLVDAPKAGKKFQTDIQKVARYFHLPINDAAKELGMCLTVLKKICRRSGLKRWPHRKLKSIDKILESLNQTLLNESGEDIAVPLGDSICDQVASVEKLDQKYPLLPW